MKIFITGGAGFIGSHLAEHFQNSGEEVTILDNFSTGSKENLEILGISNSIQLEVDNGMKIYLQHHRRRFDSKF